MMVTVRIQTLVWLVTGLVLGVVATVVVTAAWDVDAAPGDADSTFVPTAGCRLVDTRTGADNVGDRSAALGPGDIFEIDVHGSNGECTGPLAIPVDAVGVAFNVTAVNATARSNLRIYPGDLAEVPLLSNLNVTPGGPPTPNKVDVQLSPSGSVKVFNFNGSVDVIFDVVGYYTKSSLLEIDQRLDALENPERRVVVTGAAFQAALGATTYISAGTCASNLTTVTGLLLELVVIRGEGQAFGSGSRMVRPLTGCPPRNGGVWLTTWLATEVSDEAVAEERSDRSKRHCPSSSAHQRAFEKGTQQ